MRIGIRELKANLSEYMESVGAGEVITVTKRGRGIPLHATITTDGPLTIHLDGLCGGTLRIDGASAGPFCGSVSLPGGTHSVEVAPI